MNNLILTLLLAFASFLTACSTEGGNSTATSANEVRPSTPAAAATPEEPSSAAAECKICNFDYSSYKGDLKKVEVDGLLLALNDEYLAAATYQQVNKDFDDPRPFVNIVQAEIKHADMLKGLYTKYGIAIPQNPWSENVPRFTSVADACKAGVQGEIANRDLYSRLFKTTERQDIVDVYRYLQRASEENHLPAFEKCGGGRGPGMGPGNGRGPMRRN